MVVPFMENSNLQMQLVVYYGTKGGKCMDRRQRKSREAILRAFTELLAGKHYNQITVEQIIHRADVGRATFYAHFETKDTLLRELNRELFCHIFDAAKGESHRHIFSCDAPKSPFLHLFQHLSNNDNQILRLLSSPSNELFRKSFKEELAMMIRTESDWVAIGRVKALPEEFWIHHAAATFVETVCWWLEHGKKESPEKICEYYLLALNIGDVLPEPKKLDISG